MDKIWDRNPSKSEVIGRCGGDEKPIDQAESTLFCFIYTTRVRFKE